jgi:hypothetical protein
MFILLMLFSCSRRRLDAEIIPPATPPLSRSIIGYGVISGAYTHVMDKKGGAIEVGLLRKGAIVEVLERRPVVTEGVAESWVLASGDNYSGWVREKEVTIYNSRSQAKTAAGLILQ